MNAQTEHKRLLPEGPIAVLDIGTVKIICLIAEFSTGAPRILGASLRAMAGMKDGAVIDRAAATQAIVSAVDTAEKMAGKTIERAVVAVSGGYPSSHFVELDMDIGGHAVRAGDVQSIIDRAHQQVTTAGRMVVHALPAAFGLNGAYGTKPPVGLTGDQLSVAMHMITAQAGPLQNLKSAVASAHLDPQALVLAPYATGLGAVTPDEARMGVAVVDFGGGSRDIAIFARDALLHTEILSGGGEDITESIARALYTPLGEARKLMAHGSAIYQPSDERSLIDIQQVGESGLQQQPRARLTRLMEEALRRQLSEVGAKLSAAGFDGEAGRCVVLTGGVAQLDGMRDLASDVLGRHVRVARAPKLPGMPASAENPAYVTAVGLLRFLLTHPDAVSAQQKPKGDRRGRVARLLGWMRENV